MHRFFAPDIASTHALPEEESRHCVRVLRLVEGDEVEVIDGQGTLYRCRITMAHNKHCALEIVSQEQCKPHWGASITLAVAPTKNLDRIEWMTEKCTEMGIDRIVPLLCRHSERKVLKTERLHKIYENLADRLSNTAISLGDSFCFKVFSPSNKYISSKAASTGSE